jgi:hypothetical protein
MELGTHIGAPIVTAHRGWRDARRSRFGSMIGFAPAAIAVR